MDQPGPNSPNLPSSITDTAPRFALRLDLDGFIQVIAGLLPGLVGTGPIRTAITNGIVKNTGSPELAKLRELRVFFGPQAEPETAGQRQLQVRLLGNWDAERLLAELAAHPSQQLRVEETPQGKRLRLGKLHDITGRFTADGALVFASDDLTPGPLGEIVAPPLPFEIERLLAEVPLFMLSRRGGPWWQAVSTWVNQRIPDGDADLARTLHDALQQVCLHLDANDELVIDLQHNDLAVAERLRARLDEIRREWAAHLAPERLEPGPQNAASPVFQFFTMPLTAAMPLLQILRHVIQQIQISTELSAVRLRLPLRIAFAGLSSPIALFGLLPAIPLLIATVTAAAKPAMARVSEAFRDRGCAAARKAVDNACRMYCLEHVSAADPTFCPDLTILRASGYLTDETACPQGGSFSLVRRGNEFEVTCSVHPDTH